MCVRVCVRVCLRVSVGWLCVCFNVRHTLEYVGPGSMEYNKFPMLVLCLHYAGKTILARPIQQNTNYEKKQSFG